MEMARLAESPTEGLRMMKSLGADYLTLEFEDVPVKFWEYLFPMPYRKDVVATARLRALDPYILAGLIRQESEFDPKARSHKNAYGLTQVLPSTGRQIARNAGVSKFRTPMLYQPAVNLKLGSYYLRSMLDQWGGKWEHTLAAYNAGPHRVSEWLTWNSYSEPAEFIETIPFTETREYVQAVLRNAALYRRLYPEQKDERVENKKVLPKNSTPAVKTTRKATAGKAKRSASKKAA
jgi:soluble lytic murein transglycosylase